MKKYKNLDELETLYKEGEAADKALYSEMRSNVLLIAGEHYSKNVNKHFARLRETNRLTETLKLRLTKNHTHKIHRVYTNAIVSKVPGATCIPANESEMQDQKDAELNNKILKAVKKKHNLKGKIRKWASEYVGIGEVATKIFWDPNKGDLKGYQQKVTEEGQPVFKDQEGKETLEQGIPGDPGNPMFGIPPTEGVQFEPVADKELPVFGGDYVFESLFGFNIFRSPGAKDMHESEFIGIRKMVPVDELKLLYRDNEEALKKIDKTSSTDFIVFDSAKASYEKTEKWALLKECYYQPCLKYPEGYYYMWTEFGILDQGVLPYGIFPIIWQGFDEHPSTPRGRSILKVVRPYQAEINRAASQRATHQITLGDDKILYQAGTKLAPGALLPGARGISYQGTPPTVIPGRTGEQFASYVQEEKSEMYEAAMVPEMGMDESANLDPYTMLFRSMSQQAKYKIYIEKFEEFVVDIHTIILKLARVYMPDDELVEIVGPKEAANLAEFKNQKKLRYEVNIEPQTDSVDTMLGKQLTFNHLLQYIGKNLKPDQIGMVVKNMPFVNNEEMLGDLTINYDNVKNDMLALERGEQVQISQYDDNEYYIQKLTHRMKQGDFRQLEPQVQQAYMALLQQNQEAVAQKQQSIIDAKNEYVPVGGAMVAIDMYVPDKQDPTKAPKRARVPYQAVEWLLQLLDKQGMSLDSLESMNQGALAEIAGQIKPQAAPGGLEQEKMNQMKLQQQQSMN